MNIFLKKEQKQAWSNVEKFSQIKFKLNSTSSIFFA